MAKQPESKNTAVAALAAQPGEINAKLDQVNQDLITCIIMNSNSHNVIINQEKFNHLDDFLIIAPKDIMDMAAVQPWPL